MSTKEILCSHTQPNVNKAKKSPETALRLKLLQSVFFIPEAIRS